MTEILCPVCDLPMSETETKRLYSCARQTIHVPELDCEIETIHAMYYLDSQDNPVIKTIEVLPYAFEIHNDPRALKQTRISRIIKENKMGNAIHWVSYGNRRFLREELIVVPGTVNCQWNDRSSVLEKVRMYMLFS